MIMNKHYENCLRRNNVPARPTRELIDEYLLKYSNTDIIKHEVSVREVLKRSFPKYDYNDIFITVVMINQMYSTNLYRVHDMAKHIYNKGEEIYSLIKNGDSHVVDLIARVELGEGEKRKQYNMYSFATKFCAHFNPDEFPIYDSYVEVMLTWYYDRFREENPEVKKLNDKDFKDYDRFREVVKQFIERYDLRKAGGETYSIKEIDNFLWLYCKEMLREAKERE